MYRCDSFWVNSVKGLGSVSGLIFLLMVPEPSFFAHGVALPLCQRCINCVPVALSQDSVLSIWFMWLCFAGTTLSWWLWLHAHWCQSSNFFFLNIVLAALDLLPFQFLGKIVRDGSSLWAHASHVGDTDAILGPWPLPGQPWPLLVT